MKIYSTKLTSGDIHQAATGIDIVIEIDRAMPNTRIRGWGWVLRTSSASGAGRRKNTGTRGASIEPAATWNAHGWWIAKLYEKDSNMVVIGSGRYENSDDFHTKTNNQFSKQIRGFTSVQSNSTAVPDPHR